MKIIVNGVTGRMGKTVAELISSGKDGHCLAAGVDPVCPSGLVPGNYASLEEVPDAENADVIIDFSHHSATKELTDYCIAHNLPLVIATTGQTPEEREIIFAAAEKIPLFFSANMSLGVAALAALAKRAAELFPDADIEIVESHHNQKLDVPSGTALMLLDSIKQARPEAEAVIGRHANGKRKKGEIGIHSLRLGGDVGAHEVILATGTEVLTLKHQAQSRALFADGALAAAEFLLGKPAGLYTMADLVKGEDA